MNMIRLHLFPSNMNEHVYQVLECTIEETSYPKLSQIFDRLAEVRFPTLVNPS